MKKVELLAPAGNIESLNCAINNGADAVYLGLSNFNARGNIENFNLENLRASVQKAHLFGVRVFLTLNTLILDEEIDDILLLVRGAIDAKVDAFIVQDIGLAYLLRNKFPKIELHASTQMGIQNLEGALFLKPLHYKRVVLARETPLSEIKRIKNNLDIEIEYFVQGALCVSFSGNCYLCSLYASASGNRGKCKQFCRLLFVMQSENQRKEGYFLSTKDFCMLPCLQDLVESGVSSLKIEGRARRPAYVAGAVKVYRETIDNDFKFNARSIEILKKLFNRGDYICGYLNNENIIYNKTQNHIGVAIGKVLEFKKGIRFNEVIVESNHKIKKGDSLKFFEREKEICSLNVQDVKNIKKNIYLFTTTTCVPEKASVNLIVDSGLEEGLLSHKKKIYVEAKFVGHEGKPASLTLKAGDTEVVATLGTLERAKGQPLTSEECLNQISKMGEDFALTSLDADIQNVFMAKSQINQLRRDAVCLLQKKLIENHEKNLKIEEKDFSLTLDFQNQKNDNKILYFSSLKTLEKYINSENLLVYEPKVYNFSEIIELCNKFKSKTIYLSLPVIADENLINSLKNLYNQVSNLGVVANNYYAFCFTTPEKTIVGSNMNVTNSYAVQYYKSQGYDKIILSKENFDFQNIQDGGAKLFIESKIRKSLMHFKHCPFKENWGGTCQNCKFKDGMIYKLRNQTYCLERKKIGSCQFVLKQNNITPAQNKNFGSVEEIED